MKQGMGIYVIPSTFDCLNMGDAAMLQTTVSRLKAFWPDASIRVPTSDVSLLRSLCPASEPLLRSKGSRPGARSILGRVAARVLRPRFSSGEGAGAAMPRSTRLVVASGAGGINDVFGSYSRLVFSTLEEAFRRNVPTALLGHGFGPLQDRELLARARRVLPRVDLIALREGVSGPAILDQVGVDPSRVRTTGDDAVAAAYESRPSALGRHVGVNLRVSANASVEESDIAALRPVLLDFAARHDAPLLPMPISRKGGVDAQAIRSLLGGNGASASAGGGEDLDTPDAVIRQAGRCRIVVTGAYHAAVFALSQGVPAICLYRSEYFEKKFLGLRDLFGPGCEPLALENGWAEALSLRMKAAWDDAGNLRPRLLESARRQIRMGHEAYDELRSIVEARN